MEVLLEDILGIISRLGKWLDTRFPEKISAEEVYRSLTAYAHIDVKMAVLESKIATINQKLQAFETGAGAFDKSLAELKDELNKVKAVQVVMNRQRTTPLMPSGEAWKR